MIERVAYFAKSEEVDDFFGFEIVDSLLYKANYNITPGLKVPVLLPGNKEEDMMFDAIPWGKLQGEGNEKLTIEKEAVELNLKAGHAVACLILISGFFIWKNSKEKGYPFLVRMLNQPFMAVAGLFYEKDNYVQIVTTESNPLIQPMSEKMPLILNKTLSLKWIHNQSETGTLIHEATHLFLLTDLSVMRVSKKINNPKNNGPDLIQPIPK